ncbi:MAG: RNA polymerase sigma factor [Anaerolineae bacterium]
MDVIERSRAGEERAFAELFGQYKNLVFKTAYLMLGEPQEAEDALQEVFLRVHRSLRSYQPSKGAFTTWLHRITVNHCINRTRKRHLRFLPIAQVHPGDMPSQPSPGDRLDDEDAVARALRGLSAKLRAVVVLRYYWDMSYGEIAETLGIPLGTVKSRLNAALRALRAELEPSVSVRLSDGDRATTFDSPNVGGTSQCATGRHGDAGLRS